MSVKNLGQLDEPKNRLEKAIASGDEAQIALAMEHFGNSIQERIINEARDIAETAGNDVAVLNARGVHQLTAAEKKYYNAVIGGHNPDGERGSNGFVQDGTEGLIPATIVNRVFERIRQDRPLLDAINILRVGATTELVLRRGDAQNAHWGTLSAAHKELIDKGFTKMKMHLNKLSAFIPLSNSMLELGPEWLDLYVRTVLAESVSGALEQGAVSGTGYVGSQPIGMLRDFENPANEKAVSGTLTNLSPQALGAQIIYPLTKNGTRTVKDVIMVVNPKDYWEKIFGATTYLNTSGQYVPNVLPIPGKFIQSNYVPEGKMIVGMGNDYFMGVGFDKGIEVSDEVRFIEDERVYRVRMAANGQPLDNDSFRILDIRKLQTTLALPVDVK